MSAAWSLRGWCLRFPRPSLIKVISGDRTDVVEKTENQSWHDIAQTIEAFEPERVEAYDRDGKLLRACRCDESDSIDDEQAETPEKKGTKTPYDAETERLRVVATLISDAYKFATGVAFERMMGLFDAVSRQSEAQARALNETHRLLGKAYQEQVNMALEQAEQGSEGSQDPLGNMLSAVISGAQQGAVERAMKSQSPSNGKGNQV